jgi:CSLREA domain-containing protein
MKSPLSALRELTRRRAAHLASLLFVSLTLALLATFALRGVRADTWGKFGTTEESRVGQLFSQLAPQTFPSTREAAHGEAALKLLKERGQSESLQQALETARYRAHAAPQRAGEFLALNPAQALHSRFTPQGVEVRRHSEEQTPKLAMTLRGIGYGDRQLAVSPGTVTAQNQRIEIHRTIGDEKPSSLIPHPSSLTEWYVNRPTGLEQGFTIAAPPSGAGERQAGERLRLTLELSGAWQARTSADGQSVDFSEAAGGGTLRYDHLVVRDAQGKTLPARMSLIQRELRLEVEDAGAVWPVTIDPTLAQQAYLKASNTGENDRFGTSVAVSGDTVVVGASDEDSSTTGVNSTPNEAAPDSGAAYVFVRNAGVWTQQAYLKASNTGADDGFGTSVAVAGDTVVVGASAENSTSTGVNSSPNDSGFVVGAAYVFVRNAGVWTQQAYLKASNTGNFDQFGASVAVAGDTVVVGAVFEDSDTTGVNSTPNEGATESGAAYVFVRNAGVWTQQAYLKASNTGAGDLFGSVAVSGDTVVVGAYGERSSTTGVNSTPNDLASGAGAAYVFVRNTGVWTQQAYLKASNTGMNHLFGISVAAAGDTVVVGATGESSSAGAAYVFVRSAGVWTQQAYLKASNAGGDDKFGQSVAVAGDTVVVGAFQEDSSTTGVNSTPNNGAGNSGAAYVFGRSGTTWTQESYLKASNTGGADNFGISAAISGDTVVVGAYGEASNATGVNGNQNDNLAPGAGAAYAFTIIELPSITAAGPLSRTQGNAASNSTIATVSDSSVGTLSVSATTVPTGISITNIVNTGGTVTADVAADCTAAGGANTVVLTVTNQTTGLSATANLTVNVTAAAAPTTANAGPDQTLCATAPATLAANESSIGTGAWSIVNGPSLSTAQFNSLTNPAATFTPAGGAGAYTLRWTITGACATSTDDVVLTYNAQPAITLGASPAVFSGTTSANLPYTATTDSPNQYSIDYNAAANTAGFADVTNASLMASPIVLTVPGAAAPGVYHATLTVRNNTTGCASSGVAFTVTISACVTSLSVNNTGDGADATPGNGVCETATGNGLCTLRAAIQEANALTACTPFTINFSVTGAIALGSVLPNLNHPNLTINNGADPTQLTVRRDTGGNYRIFTITTGRTVTINGLTMRDGNVGASGFAGGIYNDNGTLTLNDCVVSNNTAGTTGAGIGIFSGTTTINRTTIADNTLVTGTSTIVNGAGMYINQGTVTLNATTFSGNRKNDAFPTSIQGAALLLNSATVTATNCTFSNNTGRQVIGNFATSQHNSLTLLNCTISNNTLNSTGVAFGAVETLGISAGVTATTIVKNTIVASNPGNGTAFRTSVNGFSTLTSQGNNLCGDATLTPTASGDLTNTNPLLAALGNYGGLTQTHALLPGSPAINAGTASGAPANDQRGIARAGNVDIGAFESQGFTLALSSGNNQSAVTSTAFANPLSVSVVSVFSEPVNGGQVTFTPPVSGASATLAGNPATISSGTATTGIVTANAVIGGPYIVTANANGATPTVNFTLTNLNSAPGFTPAAALARQQGSPAGEAVTIGLVSDAQSPAGGLTVTQIAGGTATGITVTGITNNSGTITAMVSAACTASAGTVRFQVSDGDLTGTGELQVNVTANSAPTLSYPATANVAAGGATLVSVTTAGDNGSITGYSLVSVVPPLTTVPTVNSSGVVSITNAGPSGNHTITVQATDDCGATTDASFTLTVNCQTITVNAPGINTGTVGTAFSQMFTQTGGLGATTFSTASTLPNGITLAANGLLSGTPTQPGSFPLNVVATDGNGCTGTINYTLTITCPTITVNPTNPSLPNGRAGTPYSQTFTQTGALGAVTFSVSAGALPTGLTLAPGGLLSGTPTVNGQFNFTVKATEVNTCFGEQAYTLLLHPPCTTITVNPATLANGFQGTAYNQTLTASGGTAPYTFAVTGGSLPGGLNLASGGALTGTPTAAGSFNFTVTATDNTGCTGTRAYTVIISGTGLQFYPLPAPVRLLDTRAGEIACTQPSAPIAGQTSLTQMGRGLCNIPANAVALTGNLTTVQSGGGYLTLYPSNAPQPTVASTNYNANEIINNVFTVGLGPDGAFKIFAFFTTEVVVDVTGYYAPPSTGGLYFHPLPKPIRLLETRAGEVGCNTPGAPIQGGVAGTRTQQARLTCDGVTIPNGALAIVGNATTVGPQAGGYLTLFPANAAQPLVASSNYNAGQVVNGPFSVGLAPTGEFNIFTFATTHLVVDVLGYYSSEANDVNGAGLLFNPLPKPVRLLETRANQAVGCYLPGLPLISGVENTQPARGACDGVTIPANALGVVGNATVVTPNAAGFLTLWPSTALRPLVATANYNAGDIGNRHFIVGLGAGDGAFKLFSSATTELVIDLSGYFAP